MFAFLYDLTIKTDQVNFSVVLLCQKTRTFICCLAFQLCCKCIWLQ